MSKVEQLEEERDEARVDAAINGDIVRVFVSAVGPDLQVLISDVKPKLLEIRRLLKEQNEVEYRSDEVAIFDQLMMFLAEEINNQIDA